MTTLTKAIAVAAIHILIVLSLGGKLLYDRAHRPRVWVKTAGYDPDLPIRGRYVTLNLQVPAPEGTRVPHQGDKDYYQMTYVDLAVENGQLIAHKSERSGDMYVTTWGTRRDLTGAVSFVLSPAVAFFLPEHADFPRLKPGDEIWAEVTVPRKGPPRPIQRALKKGTEWVPLTYR
jgi:hypothetical protein